jgi:ABC-type branched-subunit amino acid transport system substrate-binding protein
LAFIPTPAAAEVGVTATSIRVGGVMDLQGDSSGLGLGMKAGIEAALKNQQVQGDTIDFVVLNDFYEPKIAAEATQKLIHEGIFAMLGNVGTPTAAVVLPILAEHKMPAVGFFTGAGLLRPGVGDVINFRASYTQEVAEVVRAAINAGVRPEEICAYVQNDAYGMAGVEGLKRALQGLPNTGKIIQGIERVQALPDANPARNNVGPIGFYQRNTLRSREGYASLKHWEQATGTRCRLVVTVGTYKGIGNFAGYSRIKGETWVLSAVSFTGAEDFRSALNDYGITDRVIMTQVVPHLDSELPIVADARKALGGDLSYVSLEGYIVGRMFLTIAQKIKGGITRESFLKAVQGQKFDLGGLPLDFSDDNQGSNLVEITYFEGGDFKEVEGDVWKRLFRN